jgi:hypothetical protein
MTLRNVAVIKDGKVLNTILVEDDPANWPGYVRACNPPDVDALVELAKHHDAVIELHDGEACEIGMMVKPAVLPVGEKVVRLVEGEKTVRFEKVAPIEEPAQVIK